MNQKRPCAGFPIRIIGLTVAGIASVATRWANVSFAEQVSSPVGESAVQIVQKYAAALTPYSRVAYFADIRDASTVNGKHVPPKTTYGVSEDEKGRAIFRRFYRRDNNRLDILSLKEGVQPGPDVWLSPEKHLSHVVVDNSPRIFEYDAVAGRVSARTPLHYTTAQTVRQQAGWLWGGQALDGIIECRPDKILADILAGAADLRLRLNPQPVDGHDVYLLECTDHGYEYQVWIDPAAGYHPRRLIQRRVDQQTDGADVVVDHIEISSPGGRFIATAAHITSTYRSGPNYEFKSDTDFKRSDIDFKPDFDSVGAFKITAPPKTSAKNEDDTSRTEWAFKDGKFTPKTTVESLADEDAARKAMDALVGKTAPELTGPTWLAERSVNWADLKGKVVILSFWAIWCEPCRDDLLQLQELHREHERTGIVVIGVHSAGTPMETVRNFLAEYKVDYPVCIDSEQTHDLFRQFHVTTIPHVFVIGPDGKVVTHGLLSDAIKSARSLARGVLANRHS
jgi:peroxiredoxin